MDTEYTEAPEWSVEKEEKEEKEEQEEEECEDRARYTQQERDKLMQDILAEMRAESSGGRGVGENSFPAEAAGSGTASLRLFKSVCFVCPCIGSRGQHLLCGCRRYFRLANLKYLI